MAGMADIAADCKISVADVKAVFTSLRMRLKKGEAVSIQRFGNFRLMHKKSVSGRNPQTGEIIAIPEGLRLRFSASKSFKDEVNGRLK